MLSLRETLKNARGEKRKMLYDPAGRITGYISPEETVGYVYDANGNVLSVTDKHGTIRRAFDALNRVSSYTTRMVIKDGVERYR